MPVWAAGAFLWCLLCSYATGAALLGHLVPLPFSTELPLLCGLCVSTVALAGVPVLFWCFVHMVCAAFVVFPCSAYLLLLLPLGRFWDISAGLLYTTACPVHVPALFLLLPAPVLKLVHLGLLLAPVCALGWFCAPACAWL